MNARRIRGRVARLVGLVATTLLLTGMLGGVAHAVINCAIGANCPSAQDDSYTTTFDTKLTVDAAHGVLANDLGPVAPTDGAPTTVDVANTVLDGGGSGSSFPSWNGATVTIHADGSFVYAPDPANPYSGDDSFDYDIKDAQGDTDFATATVTVLPVVNDDTYSVVLNHTLNVAPPGVFANDKGIDESSVVFDTLSVHGGNVTVNEDGSFSYTPKTGFTGADRFTYTVWNLDDDDFFTATVTIEVTPPPPPKPQGYWMVGASGIVYPFGQVKSYGNASGSEISHLEPTPSRHGYWIVNSVGHVFAFGDAHSYGDAPALRRGEAITSISATPTGKGYWLFSNRGRAVARGDAKFLGDVHTVALNGPIVGSVATPTGRGYYLVGSDGGIFGFGDAKFYGSMGGKHLNKPVNGIVPTANVKGYWLVASDGGIFGFGNATFRGSMGNVHLNRPIIGMVRYGSGYLMVGSDGGIFAFSNLPFFGSLGGRILPEPIVGVAAGG